MVAGGDGQGLEVEVRVLFVERFKHFDFHRQFLLKKKGVDTDHELRLARLAKYG